MRLLATKGVLYQMSPKAMDAVTLRRYLLGQLPEGEQEALDLWLLSEDEAYDLIAAAEDDLIDDSVAGRLNMHDQERFQNHFLLAPERQRKLDFARRLRNYLDQPRESAIAKTPSLMEQIVALFRYRPAFAAATALVAVSVAVGGFWTLQLQSRLSSTEGRIAEVQRQRDDLSHQLDEARGQSDRIHGQFAQLQTALTDLGPAFAKGLMTLSLVPSARTRSEGNVSTATITPGTHLIQLSLTLPDSDGSNYRIVLSDGDQEILRGEKITATTTSQGKVLILTLPTDKLGDGDYNLRVMSTVDPAAPEVVASYSFRAIHTAK